jgi:hypothetical protein
MPKNDDARNLPAYLELGGGQVYQQPYRQQGAGMYCFLLPSDLEAQKRTVDRALNLPINTATTYVPLLPYVMAVVAPIQKITSVDPPDSGKGWQTETDIGFWMLVGAGRMDGDEFKLDRVAWYLPYVWVTTPQAVMSGREVYGFPKGFGWFDLPAPGTIGAVRAETTVLNPYSPSTELKREVVLTLTPPAGSDGKPFETLLKEGAAAVKEILAAVLGRDDGIVEVPTWRLALNLLEELLKGEVPSVYLKQFRDAADPTRACYQAIVEAGMKITAFHGAGFLPSGYTAWVANYDSHPICSDLGLAEGDQPVALAFYSSADFDILNGRIVAEAGPSRA